MTARIGVVAGLLCALGVMSASVLRTSDHPHHRMPALAAVLSAVDSHGAQLRGDHAAVQTVRVRLADSPRPAATMAASVAAPTRSAVDTVRTRGPPGTAA